MSAALRPVGLLDVLSSECSMRESRMNDRQRSQILGIIVIATVILLIACIRYCFRLG